MIKLICNLCKHDLTMIKCTNGQIVFQCTNKECNNSEGISELTDLDNECFVEE